LDQSLIEVIAIQAKLHVPGNKGSQCFT